MGEYHKSVMLKECLQGLAIKPDGIYVDATFGGGGHSEAILEQLDGGKLYAFDQDEQARANVEAMDKPCFTLIASNFRYMKRYLRIHGILKVDGILADLGVSSHQIDDPARGFSTRFDGKLDMRMDRSASITAKTVVNSYGKVELHRILSRYGEVKNAKTLASAIVSERTNRPIDTVADLKQILNRYVKYGKEFKYYAQVFQAIRIEVNEEMKALEEMLKQTIEVLSTGGRLVVISYHSLEDRMVKNFIKKGQVYGEAEKDFYGNVLKSLTGINKKPIVPTAEEIKKNNRARSAKLRVAEKQ